MLPFAKNQVKIKRGKYANSLVKVLKIYMNRKNKTLVITDKILEGKNVKGKSTKRRLVVSYYNLTNDLS